MGALSPYLEICSLSAHDQEEQKKNKHQQQLQPQNFHSTWRHAPSVIMIINNNRTTSPNKNNISKQKQHLQTKTTPPNKTTSQKIQIQNSNNTWGYDLTVFEIFYGVEMMIAMDGRRTNKFLERQMK